MALVALSAVHAQDFRAAPPVTGRPVLELAAWPENACTPLLRASDCAFYQCRETQRQQLADEPCAGRDNYYLSYGYKYCSRFSARQPRFSSKGRLWVAGVRSCLMGYLDRNVTLQASCLEVRSIAMRSHPGCYVTPSPDVPGICSLKPDDWLRILTAIEPKDSNLQQAIITKALCIQRWLRRRHGAPKNWNRGLDEDRQALEASEGLADVGQ